MDVPHVRVTSATRAMLFADDAEYTLGLPVDDSEKKAARATQRHDAYVELIHRCLLATGEPFVEAVFNFVNNHPLSKLTLPADFDGSGIITFRVEGYLPIRHSAVQEFWLAENSDSSRVMQYIVCSQERPVLERLKETLKGVPGTSQGETTLVAAHEEAFQSYGLASTFVSPICASCGERVIKAANALLSDDSTRMTLGNNAFIFWTRFPTEFSFLEPLDAPKPEQVRDLLKSVRTGERRPVVEPNAFYATILTGNVARAVVCDWIETTVSEAQQHLADWFAYQWIVGPGGDNPRPFGIRSLAAGAMRPHEDLNRPAASAVIHALLRSALTGKPVPRSVLYQAVQSITLAGHKRRRDRGISHEKAALIKLALLSMHAVTTEDLMAQLNLDNPSPAYHCGRMLAILEEIQEEAIYKINSTIADRYFAAASMTPAATFSRLLVGAKHHLAKIKRDKPNAYYALQQRLDGVVTNLKPNLPRILAIEEQGLFALGYYQQRAYDQQARDAAVRRKKEKALIQTDPNGEGATVGIAATDEASSLE